MDDLSHIQYSNARAWGQIVDAIESGEHRVSCGFLPDEIDCPASLDFTQRTFGEFVRRYAFRPFRLGEDLPSSQGEGDTVLCVVDRGDLSVESFSRTIADAVGLSLEYFVVSDVEVPRLVQAISQAALILNFSSDWNMSFAIDELGIRLGRGVVKFANPGYSPIRYALLGCVLPSEFVPQKDDVRSSKFLDIFKKQILLQRSTFPSVEKFDIRDLSTSFWSNLYDSEGALLFWHRAGLALSAFRVTSSWVDRFSGWPALWKLLSGDSLSPVGRKAMNMTIRNSSNTWRESRQRIGVINSALALCASRGDEWLGIYGSTFIRTPIDVPQLLNCMDDVDFEKSRSTVARVLGFLTSAEDAKSARLLVDLRDAWRFRWNDVGRIINKNLEIAESWRRLFFNSFVRSMSEADREIGSRCCLSGKKGLGLFEASMGAAGPLLYLFLEFQLGNKLSSRRNLKALLASASGHGKQNVAPLLRVAFPDYEEYLERISCLTDSPKLQIEDLIWLIVSCWSAKRGWLLRKRSLNLDVTYELGIAVGLVASVSIASSENYRFLEFSARLLSIAGRYDLLEVVMRRLGALRESKLASLACRCSLDLLSRGCFDQAGDLLAQFPLSSKDAGIDCFFRAVVAHYCQDERLVRESLDVLECVDDRFFEDRTAIDGRWPWLLVLLDDSASEEVVELSRINNPDSIAFVQDSGLPNFQLGEAWKLALGRLQV